MLCPLWPVLSSCDAGLWEAEGRDCMAIVLVENAYPHELASVFLYHVRGFNVPVGTVVTISSPSHQGRVGAAAYARDIVMTFGRVETAYGRGRKGSPQTSDNGENRG